MPKKSLTKATASASGHETRDINAGAVVCFGGGLAVIFLVIFFSLRGLLGHFNHQYPGGAAAVRDSAPLTLPPGPRLQSNPTRDMELFREKENRILTSYGWIDRQEGIVRIPIERAMDIIAQRGAPTIQASSGKTPLQMRQEKANAVSPTP
jgi:hypothetical protein